MWLTDTPANLISLGAIDFGIIIDSTVIVVENICRHLHSPHANQQNKLSLIMRAGEEVGGPMLFSTLIFVIAFIPLFTMRGVAGAIFSRCLTSTRTRWRAACCLQLRFRPR